MELMEFILYLIMKQLLDLYNTLSGGEKKMISQKIAQSKSVQLHELFKEIQFGISSELSDLDGQQKSILKYQLYNRILKYLSEHKSSTSKDIEFRLELNKIEVLKSKFLFELALKKVISLKKRLQKHERFGLYQETLLIEFEINSILLTQVDQEKSIQATLEESKTAFEMNQEFLQEKINFFHATSLIHSQSGTYDTKSLKHFGKFSNTGNRSAHYYNQRTLLVIQIQNGQFSAASKTGDILGELIEYHRHEFKHLPFQSVDINFMRSLAYLLNSEENKFFSSIQEMNLHSKNEHSLIKKKSLERQLYLSSIFLNKNFASKDFLIYTLEEIEVLVYDVQIDFFNRICEQLSNYYIKLNELRAANKWNREILELNLSKRIPEFNFRAELRNLYVQKNSGREETYKRNLKRLLTSGIIKKEQTTDEMRTIFDFWK